MLEKKEKGELQLSEFEDILTLALGNPEHSGRVRGVGGIATPKSFFNTPKVKRTRITKAELLARDRLRDEEMERRTNDLMSQIADLKAMISSSILPSSMPEKAAAVEELNVDGDCVAIDPTPPSKKETKVKQALSSTRFLFIYSSYVSYGQ